MASDAAPDQAEADDAELKALVVTMSDTQRLGVVRALLTRPGMGSKEIAEWMDLPVPTVRKQLRALMESGMVDVKEREHRRGVQKLYFIGSRRTWIKAIDDRRLSRRQRQKVGLEILRNVVGEARSAIADPDYGARPGRMVASVPGTVDEQAWRELSDAQHELLDRMVEIVDAGSARLAESGEEPIRLTTALLLLELPKQEGRGDSSGG